MKIKIYRNPVCLLWFLKIIFDMFYEAKILSMVIMAFAFFLCFVKIIRLKKFIIKKEDVLVFLIFCLFTVSFIKAPGEYTDYIKIVSSLSLYVLGRTYVKNTDQVWDTIAVTLYLVFIINAVVCLFGGGQLLWGHANTIRGLYFFKTDFAVVLMFFIISAIYGEKKIINKISVPLAIILIFFTNARIAYLSVLLLLMLYYQYRTDRLRKLMSVRTVFLLGAAMIIALIGMRLLANADFFRRMGFISFEVNNLEDLMSSENTQGRNTIWSMLLSAFGNEPLINRLFGAGMDFNRIHGIAGLSEHNTYIKVLLNTGYVGLFLFVVFIFSVTLKIGRTKDRRLMFYSLSIWLVFLMTGITVPTIIYTAYSWLPFYVVGSIISRADYDRRAQYAC